MRYLPLSNADRDEMRRAIGVADIDGAIRGHARAASSKISICRAENPRSRSSVISQGSRPRTSPAGVAPFFVGAGAYRHHVPASVDHLIQRSEFLTSYTPYQPEIAQGTLQYLFEFQTQVATLTGMEVANASMYDGSTACAEAVLMAHRITKRRKALLSGGLHPQYAEVVRTLAQLAGDEIVALPRRCRRAAEDLIAPDRRRHLLRRRADARISSAICAISRHRGGLPSPMARC